MKIKAMIFDMDGVVYDSEKMYFAADQAAAKKLGFDFPFEYYKQFIGAGYDTMYKTMVKDYGDEDLIKRFMELNRKEIIPIIKKGMLKFKPGFLKLAQYLEDHGIIYGLASSNYTKDINFYLKETNFENRFNFIVSANDVAKAKPAPDIFLKAWEKAGKPAKKETVIIEDSTNGIKAANQAEIPVIMVPDYIKPTTFEKEHTLAIKSDLNEVIDFIK